MSKQTHTAGPWRWTGAHWEREAREARAEILRGDSPQWDKNRWSYISECRRFIRRLYANARTEGQ